MTLTREERETIIRFDDSDNIASIYTCNQVWIRKLDRLMTESEFVKIETEDKYSKTYIFPKKWLRVQKPRLLTLEQKAKQREIALEMVAKRKQNKSEVQQ